MDNQRLRNLTTGRLHTKIQDIYEDLEYILGEKGLMTHQIPKVLRAETPWLKKTITDPRFWDDAYDPTHAGNTPLPEPTDKEREAMFTNV